MASAEVEFVDAEAFLLAPAHHHGDASETGDGRGLARMMEMTNGARLGIGLLGVEAALGIGGVHQ